jgi:hypothetical protein
MQRDIAAAAAQVEDLLAKGYRLRSIAGAPDAPKVTAGGQVFREDAPARRSSVAALRLNSGSLITASNRRYPSSAASGN